MIVLLFILFAIASAQNVTTYWYMLNPGVYNFSNYTIAYQTTQLLGLPLHARDGAIITANDTIPAITGTFTLIGDTSGNINAFVTIESAQTPVFTLNAGADVYMRNLQFAFNGTLFNPRQNSFLRLSFVNMWIGTIGVMIQTNSGPGVGMVADHLQCMNLAVCILYLSGSTANCSDCRFMNPRVSPVSVSSTAQSSLLGLSIINSVWINTQFFIYAQASPQAVPVQYPLASNWGYLNNNIIARTYAQDCIPPSQSQTPSFKAGGGIPNGGCPVCESNANQFGGPTIWQIIFLVLIGITFIALVTISLNSYFGSGVHVVTMQPRGDGAGVGKID